MNHFFALELSEEARRVVHEAAEEWRPRVMRSSWYDPADYHITLKFLGNLGEAEQPQLIEVARPIAEAASPFVVRSAPCGGFPDMVAPSVNFAIAACYWTFLVLGSSVILVGLVARLRKR